jgi:hypothetical protein
MAKIVLAEKEQIMNIKDSLHVCIHKTQDKVIEE